MNRKRDKLPSWLRLPSRSSKQKESHDDVSRSKLQADVGAQAVGSSGHSKIATATEPIAKSDSGQTAEPEQDTDNGLLERAPRSVWQLAWDSLPHRDRLLIETVARSSGDGENILSDLERIALQRKQDLHDLKGTDKTQIVGEDAPRVQVTVSRIITCLRRFKEVGDIAVSFDPVHAALPWAAFRFVLEALTVADEQRELLFSGLERVSFLGLSVRVYEQIYLSQPLENGNESFTQLKQAIVPLCREMLVFMAMAVKRFSKSTFIHTIAAMFDPSAVSNVLTSIDVRANEMNDAASNCERFLNFQDRKKLHNLVTKELINMDAKVEELWVSLCVDERKNLLQWLSPIRYVSDHDFAKNGRVLDTGSWLLERDAFRRWEESNTSEIFWLHGIPGAGKTKLSSKVIDHAMTRLDKSRNKETMVYFYCDRNRTDHRDPACIIYTDENVCKIVEERWRLEESKGFPSKELAFDTCKEFLPMLVAAHAKTIIVLDGLDECDKESRHELIYQLKNLTENPNYLVKVFISSREDRDLFRNFISRTNLRVQANDNDNDIKTYVLAQLRDTPNSWFREKLSAELKASILQKFAEKSDGMFQWAVLLMHDLLKLKRASDVEAYLGSLPKGLEKAYQKILNEIGDQPGSAPIIAARALRWLMDSAAPLSPEELVAAVCHSSNGLAPSDSDIDTEFVLEACHNLVVFTSSTCRFAHLSVQEYLESHDWPNKPDHQLLGATCLHLLMAPEEIFTSNVLKKYAVDYWHKHLSECDPEAREATNVTGALLFKFLGHPIESSHYYRRWYSETQTRRLGHVVHLDLQPSEWAAFGAVALGLLSTVDRWIRDGTLDPSLSSDRICLLHLAVKSGNLAMCSHLLEAGADVNHWTKALGTSLSLAIDHRQYSIIELLVRQPGIDIDKSRNAQGASAIYWAVVRYDCRIMELLINAGGNPDLLQEGEVGQDAENSDYGPALHVAASMGMVDIVRTMIRGGANVNLDAGRYLTPLAQAVYAGHGEVVSCLIENGADVNLLRPLYRAVADVGVPPSKVALALINAGALDYVIGLSHAERTEEDERYENVVDWLDEQLAKSDGERRKRRFTRTLDAGAFRTVQGEDQGGSERGGRENEVNEHLSRRSGGSI